MVLKDEVVKMIFPEQCSCVFVDVFMCVSGWLQIHGDVMEGLLVNCFAAYFLEVHSQVMGDSLKHFQQGFTR